jgi:hypothetical protein
MRLSYRVQLGKKGTTREIYWDPNKVSVEAWATSMPRRSRRGGEGPSWGTPRGSCYPPTLQTSLQIVIRPITRPHINRAPNGEKGMRRAPRSHAVGAHCDHELRVCEDAFRSPTAWKTYSDRPKVKTVNMNASTCWVLPSTFEDGFSRPLRREFQRMKRMKKERAACWRFYETR